MRTRNSGLIGCPIWPQLRLSFSIEGLKFYEADHFRDSPYMGAYNETSPSVLPAWWPAYTIDIAYIYDTQPYVVQAHCNNCRSESSSVESVDRNMRSKYRCSCVLQFTRFHTVSCVLHRSMSRVIPRIEFMFPLFIDLAPVTVLCVTWVLCFQIRLARS